MKPSGVVVVVLAATVCGLSAVTQRSPKASGTPATAVDRQMAASGPRGAAPSPPTDETQNHLVAQYCTGCHNDRSKAGGLSLAGFDAARIAAEAEIAEKMIRKLRAGMMPPPQARRPEPDVVQSFVEALESKMDRLATLHPDPGWRPFQRLNRAEYRRAVRDLLAIDVDVDAYLPPDTISAGFDNVADVQTFSPSLMEGYLRAASQISRLAIGDRNASPTSVTYKLGRTGSQMRQIEGAPAGTRGGISVVHLFPADGEYVIKLSLHYEPLGGLYGRYSMLTMNINEQLDVSINGERVALVDVPANLSETDQQNGQSSLELKTPSIHIRAGPQRLTAAFIQRLDGPVDDLIAPLENTLADVSITFGVTALPHLRDLIILGPSGVTGVSETASRRKVFSCRPTSQKEEETCAADIIRRLTAEAFRGAATAEDLQDALQFYAQGRSRGDFENGVRMALQSILVSPRFLFRLEHAPAAGSAGGLVRIGDQDLASRLSFFLWGTGPDADLVKAAGQGTLRTAAGLERQVKRMLADPRAEALSTRFARQWLRLQDLEQIIPDYLSYPQYDDTLAKAMLRETELFFDSIVRDDRDVLDLLTADYTFVNERLAQHYGIPNVTGNAFRRVVVPDHRRGLVGHGSILTLTSVADRTSPVLRGKWVLEVLLGTPPPPPPPNVPALDDSVKGTHGGRLLSTRERMEEHRKNPACNNCHRVIDPLGLALENFDVTGAWRIKDNEVPVDSVGDLYDGTKMAGPAGLREALLKHSDMVLRSFTENLLTYGIGRRVDYRDMPAVRAVIRDAARNGHRISAFITGVVNSAAFRMVKPGAPARTTDAGGR
jgi:hypothetical protein